MLHSVPVEQRSSVKPDVHLYTSYCTFSQRTKTEQFQCWVFPGNELKQSVSANVCLCVRFVCMQNNVYATCK